MSALPARNAIVAPTDEWEEFERVDADPIKDFRRTPVEEASGWEEFEEVGAPTKEDPRTAFREELKEEFPTAEKDWSQMSFTERMAALGDYERETERYEALTGARAGPGLGKGLLSGTTLGITELEPGFKKAALMGPLGLLLPALKEKPEDIGFTTGEVGGSILPIEGLFKIFGSPLVKAAAKSPFAKRSLSSLARLTGWGLVGASEEGLKEAIQGEKLDPEEIGKHGLMWSALDAALSSLGVLGQFGKQMLKATSRSKRPATEIIERIGSKLNEIPSNELNAQRISDVAFDTLARETSPVEREISLTQVPVPRETGLAQEALKDIEKDATALAERKITPEENDKLEKLVFPKVEVEPAVPSEVSLEKSVDALEESAIDAPLREFYAGEPTDEEIGNIVRENIEAQRMAERDSYRPLYNRAKEAAEEILATPKRSPAQAGETLIKLEKIKTKPSGYFNVMGALKDALHDVGYTIQRNEDGTIARIIRNRSAIETTDLMELGRRLNEIIDFDVIEPTIKDQLKPLAKAVKQDIREALSSNPEALKAFEEAEARHAALAKKLDRDSVRNIRKQEAGEKISKELLSPSVIKDLKEILSPEQMRIVEKKILDHLREASYDSARKAFRELSPTLSPEARRLGRDIIEAKHPVGKIEKQRLIARGAMDDLAKAMVTGEKPKKLLGLWQNSTGRALLKHVLRDNPNKEKIFNYLKDQTFFDWTSALVDKKGAIDVSKMKDLLKDKRFLDSIHEMGGESAVSFFKELPQLISDLERNMYLTKLPTVVEQSLAKMPAPERGKYLLERAGVKAVAPSKSQQLFEKIFPSQKVPSHLKSDLQKMFEKLKSEPGEWGTKKLEEMAKKDFSLWAKLNALELFTGLSGKKLLGLTGLIALYSPKTAIVYAGYNILKKMITNPNVRNAFKRVAKPQKDFNHWMKAWGSLMNSLEEA